VVQSRGADGDGVNHAQASAGVASPGSLTDLTFAVVDVETSGLDTKRHHVLQVAVVRVDGEGRVLDTWSSLVRPRWRWAFRLGPRHIHGLTRRALRAAPTERTVMAELRRRLEGATFTAHNARFDAAFLTRSARRARESLPIEQHVCTLRLSRTLDPDRALSHRLSDLCLRYGVDNERPHDALQDALATAAVLPHLLRAHAVTDADQLSRVTSRTPTTP
jgi:DNA polymerase-3 subunit epsilon